MKTSSNISIQLLEGETVCFEIPSAAILVYWKYWVPMFSLECRRKMAVTSKRIIFTGSWFGAQSYRGAASFFYSEYEYKIYKKPRSSLIGKYTVGKFRFFGDYIKITPCTGFIKPKFVIFTEYSRRIAEIINQAN